MVRLSTGSMQTNFLAGQGAGRLGFFFFFKQKTAYEMCGRDWSSDVCSSDLDVTTNYFFRGAEQEDSGLIVQPSFGASTEVAEGRSEERRVGKECRSRWSPYH